ncbi:MAG TPA: LacI family DNA-binding transcriptional regulator [Fimbriimonas sp.]
MRRTTIEDVARMAGVGKVTVSYVLNGRSESARISSGTAEKVLNAARELNYRPNALARMLVTKQTQTLAVVFQYGDYFSAWSSFTNEVMRGVCEAAVASGYDLMLHTKPVANAECEADNLVDGRVEGALILRDQDDPTLKHLLDRDFPCVQFFTRSDDPRAAWVDADNYAGGRMATRHLLELGHRRIAMLHGSPGSVASNDRYNGYRDALESAGIPLEPRFVLQAPELSSSFEPVQRMFEGPERPTAVFVWSDDTAFLVLDVLRSMGLSVPNDVSVVGFDSLERCETTHPPLTSVRQPVREMAVRATVLLTDLLRGKQPEQKQILYPLCLDLRSSTAPPRRQ